MTQEMFDRGCTCFILPPCDFCTSLAEEEADAYGAGGKQALIPFIDRLTNEEWEMIKSKVVLVNDESL